MAKQFSDAVRNAMGNSFETTVGASPTIEIRTGAKPANCAAADTGTVLVSMTLPADWLANAAAGVKSLLGTWQANASADGVAGHYRIKQGATCHEQGNCTGTGGGGDMELQNTNIATGQQVTVTNYTLTVGGA